jgi:serine/threonine protein kinase
VLGEPYDNKVDVYSFGMVMSCVLLEHTNPFGSELTFNSEYRIAKDPTLRPKIPQHFMDDQATYGAFIQMMKQCWDHDPAQRPQMFELVSFLEEAISNSSN